MGIHSSKPAILNKSLSPKDEAFPDPRSPTPEIIRTPLQGNNQAGSKVITKNADLRQVLENGEYLSNLPNPILAAVIKSHLQYYDPRSPTQDFERTPIVLPKDNCEEIDSNCNTPHLKETPVDDLDDSIYQPNELNLDMIPKKLCDGFFDMTLDETLKDQEEPLGSSTASHEAIESNISTTKITSDKPATLLETNFDYIDNDKNEGENVNDHNTIQDAPTKLFNKFEILENDPRSPSVGIERTPIVIPKTDDFNDFAKEITDEILIKTLQFTNKELRTTFVANEKNKDELLIYEDDHINQTPRKSAPEATTSRTPLSCMKNKADCQHMRSKSANLFDQKAKSVQSSKRISHIPRLKSLAKTTHSNILVNNGGNPTGPSKTLILSGCENTPPNSHRDVWDKESSVVL